MSIFKDKYGDLVIEGAHVFGKNFDGNKFGKGGAKGFCLEIGDESWARQLESEGWNVKMKQSDPDEAPMYYIPVAVNYNERFNPNIYVYSGNRRHRMTNDTVGELNAFKFENVDIIVHGRPLIDESTHEKRIKAYAKTMHVTKEDDPFGDKYAKYDENIEELGSDEVPFRI